METKLIFTVLTLLTWNRDCQSRVDVPLVRSFQTELTHSPAEEIYFQSPYVTATSEDVLPLPQALHPTKTFEMGNSALYTEQDRMHINTVFHQFRRVQFKVANGKFRMMSCTSSQRHIHTPDYVEI